MKRTIFRFTLFLSLIIGCSSDTEETPQEPILPMATFSASQTAIETGNSVDFTDASENASTYAWSFTGGNPSTSNEKNPTVTYDTAGNYTVSLKVTNSDGEDTETKTDYIMVVDPAMPPTAEFSTSTNELVVGDSIDFTDQSTNAPSSWSWEFEGGDPGTSANQNPTVSYTSEGVYSVTLTVTNDDGEATETKTDYIMVTEPDMLPTAQFTASATNVDTGTSINFTDESTHEPTTWSWEFPGGDPATSIEQNPSVVYATEGTYSVTLTVANDDGEATETKADFIVVTNPVTTPEADFTASATTITSGQQISFTDTSTNVPTSWSWEFEGGNPNTSSDQNPTATYPNYGTYSVTLTSTNAAGNDTETKSGHIIVNQQIATYTVTFTSNWTSANHPVDFPTGSDHFSAAVGMVHQPGVTFFEEGQKASEGIEDMAELGNNAALSAEINTQVGAGALSYIAGKSLPHGIVEDVFEIEVTEEFSMVTLVSMIAPSPDWFVAIEAIDLFEDGVFMETITVDGVSYDSGTDSGTTFQSGNDDTDPAENIVKITTAPLGNGETVDPRMAYFTFVKN